MNVHARFRAFAAFSIFLLMIFASVPYALSQGTSASLSILVQDPQQAVIQGAQVTIRSVDTGFHLTLKTNRDGTVVFPSLQPITYTLSVRKQGFSETVFDTFKLDVSAAKSLAVTMKVGAENQTVTVNAASELTETGGAISTVIDHTFIENMPLNGNSLSTLFELTPGTVTNASGGSQAGGGGLSVNGQRGTSNYLTLDGASENIYVPLLTNSVSSNVTGQGIAVSASGGTNGLLPTDAVEEYRIQTSTYSAEYGRTPGGQIGIRTRSGSNIFHGSVFEKFRNQVMDATDYFIKFLNEQQTPLRMNDFGGTLGGPLLKDKVFFFLAHESLLMRQPNPGYSTDVPSACAKSTAAASFQPFLAAFPAGNAGPDVTTALCYPSQPESSTNQPVSDLLNAAYSQRIKDHSTSGRIDANLPWRSKVFLRINDAPSSQYEATWYPTNYTTNIWTTTGGITSQIGSTTLNELTVNYSHNNNRNGQYLASYGGNNPSAFTNAVTSVANPKSTYFSFDATLWNVAPIVGPLQYNSIKQWNVVDTFSWTVGRHSVKLGFDYLWRNPVLKPYSLLLETEITSMANLQSGIISKFLYNQYYGNPDIKLANLSFFANDNWRVTNALTLNYGVRWEINPSPSASEPGLFAIQGDITNPASITEAPAGTPLFPTVYTNFAPRFGFAYSLRAKPRFGTVVRGGAGIFFDTGTAATAAQAAGEGYPYQGNGSMKNVPYSSVNWSGLVSSKPSLPQGILYVTDPALQAPRTYQWSLTLEQQIGANTSLSASYVGNNGQKLVSTVEYYTGNGTPDTTYFTNPLLNGSFSDFELITNGAESDYQSLQMQLRSQIAHRLDVIASWTWAHSIDSGDSDFSGPEAVAQYSGRGNSSNDIRHIFSSAVHYTPPGLQQNRLLKSISSGWALDTVALLQTASPLSVSAQNTAALENEYNELADIVPGVPVILHTNVNPQTGKAVPGGMMLNPAAFAVPTCACNGNSQRNGYRLFGLTQWDMAASRNWNLWDKATFNFRVDAFNLLNIPSFADVQTNFGPSYLSTFGEAQKTYAGNYGSAGGTGSGTLNGVFQNGGARSIQLSAKIRF